MAVKTFGNVGLKAEWKLGSIAWKDDNDRNTRKLDVLVQCVTTFIPQNAPPSSPTDGTFVMIGDNPSGAFVGHAGDLARYDAGNSDDGRSASWEIWVPKDGWTVNYVNGGGIGHAVYSCLYSAGGGSHSWVARYSCHAGLFMAPKFVVEGGSVVIAPEGISVYNATPTLTASISTDGSVVATSFKSQSGNVERISNAGAAYFTALTVSGLTQYKIPRVLTAGGQMGDSCFGDNGSTATCSRPLSLNGAAMPSWDSNFLAMMLGHSSFAYSYDASGASGVGNPTIGRNFYIDGSGNGWAIKTASGSGYPAYLQIDSSGALVYGASTTNPTAGVKILDLLVKWRVSKEGGIGFYGMPAPNARPAVTGSKSSNAALASLISQLAACGIISDSTT